MKKVVIWDLDGTLLDSYDVIIESLYLTFLEIGREMSRDEIHRHTIEFSTKSLFQKIAGERGIPMEQLRRRYSEISSEKYLEIKIMRNGREVLQVLKENGIENYVYTHRGRTTLPVLNNLGLTDCFKDILTSQSGFARKPDSEAIVHLIRKHELDPSNTYYVGDRSIDMACAENAGITGILYLPEGSIDVSGGGETYIVRDLMDVLTILT